MLFVDSKQSRLKPLLLRASTQPPGTPVPLHHTPAHCHQAPQRRRPRPGRVPPQATVSRWVNACIFEPLDFIARIVPHRSRRIEDPPLIAKFWGMFSNAVILV
jgi:hypothetical protein